ncbi:NADH-quinone oxidoreductase subunit NuoG, partial [Rhizobiaceae sp. 2RAB30]
MAKLKVDGRDIEVPDHYTLLQAAEEAGAEVPRFCFHERLSIAGNCRMCLVEVKGGPPKPQASCAMGVKDLRPGPNGEAPEIFTNTPMVKKAREGVMEFLLINHPLDCPICDQGGECDLQDQAMAFGVDASRYHENKRAVEDKYIGPLVKTIMTRCIHCTRCVRFTTEVAGISELGLIGRGEDAEITTYLEQAMTSELQGNVIDLCPVGALTSKPYAFQARPWELTKTETIDVMDAVGSAIRVDTRGREVMRVMPRVNEAVNEEWISDKTRFIWDGLRTQRLDRPYVRKNGKLAPASWPEAFAAIKDAVARTTPDRIGAIAGDLAAVEEIFALKQLMTSLGSANIDCRQDGAALDPALGRASYVFNPTIDGIEHADALLIIGSNPRFEASVLNARIRKRWRIGNLPVGVIGEIGDTRYAYDQLGAGADTLKGLADGKGSFFDVLKKAERPLIIIGQGALARADGSAVLGLAAKLAQAVGAVTEGWNGFAVLHTAASRVGALDLGFVPGEGGKDVAGMMDGALDVLFLLGADELDMGRIG